MLAATVAAAGSIARSDLRLEPAAGNAPSIPGAQARPAARATHLLGPVVRRVVPVVSPPLRSLAAPLPGSAPPAERPEPQTPSATPAPGTPDEAVQRTPAPGTTPGPLATFEGIGDVWRVIPPDIEGDIGPNDYVEWVNLSYAVYNRSGGLLLGPIEGRSLFSALPSGPCKTYNRGDPIVLYDRLADRWVLSQFASGTTGPYNQCIAVSTSGDPTGSYCLYPFQVSADVWNDYGKIGLWPDAYYFSFGGVPDSGTPEFTPVAWAVDRQSMLACQPASSVYFDSSNAAALAGALDPILPADLDGQSPPAAGRPDPYLMEIDGTPDRLDLFEFHVDWANPAASTFTKKADLPVPSFDSAFSCQTPPETRECIPQRDTTNKVDVLSRQLMKRLTYRNFGDHESLVVNGTVDADTDHAGVRWYELRDPFGTPSVYQASTYAPDADNRWMGSAAMDGHGDLAVGYSVSSTTTFPSIRYAGRIPGDPLDELEAEATLYAGTGSQDGTGTNGSARWGDYSSLSVDPVDDCTFWYANEYYATTTTNDWHTRIGSFRFPQCVSPPTAVEIRSFAARRRGRGVEVRWRTASETDLAGFEVFRACGSGASRRIDRSIIPARRAGETQGAAYRFLDRTPRTRLCTYRLRAVALDGTRSWYGVGSAVNS